MKLTRKSFTASTALMLMICFILPALVSPFIFKVFATQLTLTNFQGLGFLHKLKKEKKRRKGLFFLNENSDKNRLIHFAGELFDDFGIL
jgi:hypothetical protein